LIRSWPFLSIGVLTFVVFVVLEAVGDAGRETVMGQALIPVVRVLIIPMWLMRYVETFLGMGTPQRGAARSPRGTVSIFGTMTVDTRIWGTG
jgi:hypothetical protein